MSNNHVLPLAARENGLQKTGVTEMTASLTPVPGRRIVLNVLIVISFLASGSRALAQASGNGLGGGPINSFRNFGPATMPLIVPETEPPQPNPNDGFGARAAPSNPSLLQNLNIDGGIVGRAAVIFDSHQLQSFAMGSFLPSAIPVKGESFFSTGERAMVQGNGSALQLTATLPTQMGMIKTDFGAVASGLGTDGSSLSAQVAVAVVQVNQLVVGLTETAFADPDAVVPTVDLAGPNGVVTIFGPTGAPGQGRLSYYLDFSDSDYDGWIGNVSIESPIPEIQFVNGPTPFTTFNTYSQIPDFVTTIKYVSAEKVGTQTHEFWHVQFGSLFRDLGVENGGKTINDSAFGWGIQLSGGAEVFQRDCGAKNDAIGFSVVYGEGVAHYIEDLHSAADGLKGGNDAFLNGSVLEPLPAVAWYIGYLHFWNDNWQSSFAYSHVDLESVAGEPASFYRHGTYAMANLIYHVSIPGSGDPKKPNPYANVFTGFEYLYGEKQELSGNSGSDNRLMFMVNIAK